MNKLQERAIAFRQLMNYQYVIKLGRKGQIKMTLLYKEKINKITGESEIQYNKLSNK